MNIRNTNELESYFAAERYGLTRVVILLHLFVLPSLHHVTNDSTIKATVVKSIRKGTAIPPPIFFPTIIGPRGYNA